MRSRPSTAPASQDGSQVVVSDQGSSSTTRTRSSSSTCAPGGVRSASATAGSGVTQSSLRMMLVTTDPRAVASS
mgnify:CR=1 FL=1